MAYNVGSQSFSLDTVHSPAAATTSPIGTIGQQQSTDAGGDASKRSVRVPTNIPEQVRGERPYYHECYFKHCTTTMALREAAAATEDVLHASAAFFSKLLMSDAPAAPCDPDAPPCGPMFAWNELLQCDAAKAVRSLRNASAWDERAHLCKRFQESVLPTCEQALFAAHRQFRGRAALPADLIPIENTSSYVSTAFGALIHVWYSNTEAKKYLTAQRVVAERIASLRLCGVSAPTTVSFVLHTITVTATLLMPLESARKVNAADGPQLQRQLRQLEVHARARSPFQAHAGADGRYYVVDCLPVLRVESESQGETSNVARSVLFDTFPNMDDFPDTLRKASRRVADAVVLELFDSVQRAADAAGGLAAVKVHDLVAARVLPRAFHLHGFKMCYAFDLLDHPRLTAASGSFVVPVGAVVKELICAEMVCRTFKEIVRAEIATNKTVLHQDAAVGAVSTLFIELANRVVFTLVIKEELWALHVMSVLRIKFATTEGFTLPQSAVTKKTIFGYLTARLGLVFEGGRFSRIQHVIGPTTAVAACPVAVLVTSGRLDDATAQVRQQWKRAVDVNNPEVMATCCRHQLVLFALCNAEADIDSSTAYLEKKLDERSSDIPTKCDMLSFFLELSLEVLPARAAACRRYMREYQKRYNKVSSQKELDVVICLQRVLTMIRCVRHLGALEVSPGETLTRSRSNVQLPPALTRQQSNAALPRLTSAVASEGNLELLPDASQGAMAKSPSSGQLHPAASPAGTMNLGETSASLAMSLDVAGDRGGVTIEDEVQELRLVALEYWRRVFVSTAPAAPANSGSGVMRLHPSVMPEAQFVWLSEVFRQLYLREGQANTSAMALTALAGAKSSRSRYERLAGSLLYCAVFSLGLEGQLPPNQRSFFRDVASEAYAIHALLYLETELPFFVAFLSLLAHELSLAKSSSLTMRQAADADGFQSHTRHILSQYLFDRDVTDGNEQEYEANDAAIWKQLKAEGYLTTVAAAATVLMDTGYWGYAKKLLAMTHHVACEGKVDGYARIQQPAHSCLKEVALTMRAAYQAVAKFQASAKRSMESKKTEQHRSTEARRKRESSSLNKSMLFGKPVPTLLALRGAKECHEVSLRHDVIFMPPVKPLDEFSSSSICGLRALLSAANPKTTSALCAVALQSGYFPPVKYAVLPFAYGHRHLVVVPDTHCVGLFFSSLWSTPSKMYDTNVPLYAKIAAQYIFSQVRFTHLFFSVVGFGWAGPIAQALMLLAPSSEMQVLMTFGSPSAFSNPKGVAAHAVHTHYVLHEDLTPRLFGCTLVPHIRQRLLGRLEGLGALLPYTPSKRQLTSLSLFGYYGDHILELQQSGADRVEIDAATFSAKGIDIRTQFIGLTPIHYVEAISNFAKTHKEDLDEEIPPQFSMYAVALAAMDNQRQQQRGGTQTALFAKAWYPPEVALLKNELLPDGSATERLRELLVVPTSVEPNVLLPEVMLLRYPKVVDRIVKGLLQLNDDYGAASDGTSNTTAVDKITKCKSVEQLVHVLQSYVGASWHPEFLAQQLCEWSGVSQGLSRQPLSTALVEAFVARHSFLFTMCPETAKSGDQSGGAIERLTRFLSEDDKATFAGPLGYHVGWSIAVSRTLHSVDTGKIVQALLGGSCQSNGVSDVHPRTAKNMFAPAIRFAYTPPVHKAAGGAVAAARQAASTNAGSPSGMSSKTSPWLLVQCSLLEATFDGSNAAQTLLRAAEQCVWVVQDEYTLQHLASSVDLSDAPARQFVVLLSQEGPAAAAGADSQTVTRSSPASPAAAATLSAIATKVKSFADSKGVTFCEVNPAIPESVSNLIALLMRDLSGSVRNPINPSVLPKGVHVGALYRHDEEEINRHIKKGMAYFIKPNTPPGGGGGHYGGGPDEERTVGRRGQAAQLKSNAPGGSGRTGNK